MKRTFGARKERQRGGCSEDSLAAAVRKSYGLALPFPLLLLLLFGHFRPQARYGGFQEGFGMSLLTLALCLNFSAAAGFSFCFDAQLFFCAKSGFDFGAGPGLVSCQPLGFFLGATTS